MQMKDSLREMFTEIANGWKIYLPRKKVSENPLDHIPKTHIPNYLKALDLIKSTDIEYVIKGSGGKGNITSGPHVEIMNPRITKSPQSGYYVVYLFSADMERLYLSLAFGVTAFKEQFRASRAHHKAMQKSAAKILQGIDLPVGASAGVLNLIESSGTVVYDYQFSSIAAIEYDLRDIPTDQTLIDDLGQMLDMYQNVLRAHGTDLDFDIQSEIMQSEIADEDNSQLEVINFALRGRRKSSGIRSKVKSSAIRRRISKSAQEIGYYGEVKILEYEKNKLIKAGRPDLAEKVSHLAAKGETPGYDIESYNEDGSILRIEVKSSQGKISVFDLTRNEKNAAEKFGPEYVLAIVQFVYLKPSVQFIINPVAEKWWNESNPSPLIWEVDLRAPFESDEQQ